LPQAALRADELLTTLGPAQAGSTQVIGFVRTYIWNVTQTEALQAC
jgi:hypothetical protein